MNKELVKLAFRMGYEAAMEKTADFRDSNIRERLRQVGAKQMRQLMPKPTLGQRIGLVAGTGLGNTPQIRTLIALRKGLRGPFSPETKALGTEVIKQVKRLNGTNDNHGRVAPGLYMSPKTTQLAQQAAVGAKDLLGAK